jgi:amino acid permease
VSSVSTLLDADAMVEDSIDASVVSALLQLTPPVKVVDLEEDLDSCPQLERTSSTEKDELVSGPTGWARPRLVVGCYCNMLNGTLGPAMLVLPVGMSRVGAAAGAGLLFVFWFFSHLGLRRMLDTCARPRASTLGQAAETHGPRISALVGVSVVLYFYGTCVSYLILMHGTIRHLISGIWRSQHAGARHGRGGATGGAPKSQQPASLSRLDAAVVRLGLSEGGRIGARLRASSALGSVGARGGDAARRLAAAERGGVSPMLSGLPEVAEGAVIGHPEGLSSDGRAGLSGHAPIGVRRRHGLWEKGTPQAGVLPAQPSTLVDATRPLVATLHASAMHASALHASLQHASPLHASPLHASPLHASPLHASPLHAASGHASPGHASPGYAPHQHVSHQHASTLALLVVTACVLAPLSCSRSLRALERVSSLVVIAYMYIALTLAFGGGTAPGAPDTHAALRASPAPEALPVELAGPVGGAMLNCLRAMPLMAYVFSSQPVYPPLVAAVHQQVPGRAGRALAWGLVHASFSTTFCFYCGVAMLGLARAPGTPPPNVLLALPNTPACLLANAALVVSVGLSFPIMLIVARSHLYQMLPSHLPPEDDSGVRAVSLTLVAGALTTAIAFPKVEACLGLIGATCSVALSFFVPAWMHWDDLVASKRLVGVRGARRTASSYGEGEEDVDGSSPGLTPDAHRLLAAVMLKQRSRSFSSLISPSSDGPPGKEPPRSLWLGMVDIVALLAFGALVAAVTIPMQVGTILGLM